MRTYERSGVIVDQCTDCRGLFLDRGELERLIDAERNWHSDQRPTREPSWQEPRHDDRGHPQQRRRKKSFLDELFD